MTEAAARDAFAYHEAGHAVLAWALGCVVRSVMIDANGGQCDCEDPPEAEGKLVLCFAGQASQRKHGPVESWHGGGDYGKAVKVAEGSGISDERVRALLGPAPGRVKLTEQQRRDITKWAEQVRLVEAVPLFGSRAKGFARRGSDVDIAITASDGNYTRFDLDWKAGLAAAVGGGLEVRVSQYRPTGHVRDHCDKCSLLLFERPADPQAAANDEVFIINGEKYEAKIYCLGWDEGDTVIFMDGSPLGVCVSATLFNLDRREKCEVWCE